MKLKSNGYKPLTTGKFKTRKELVLKVLALSKKGKLNQIEIGERCGISQATVSVIVVEARS